MPENANEVVVSLSASRKVVKAKVIGMQITVIGNQVNPLTYEPYTHTMTVVGYMLNGEESCYVFDDYFADRSGTVNTVILTFTDEAKLNKARNKINEMGYSVVRLYGDKNTQSIDGMLSALRALLLFAVMMLAYRVVTGSYRALEASKQKDYNIMRTVGLPSRFIKLTYYAEMILQAFWGWIGGLVLTVAISLIYGFAVTLDAGVMWSLLGDNVGRIILLVILSFVVDVFVTIFNAVRFNRYFYQKTVKASLREDVHND